MKAKVLVAVVTFNALPWIRRCLGSALRSSHPCDVTVIDNVSSDGTRDVVRAEFPEVELIESRTNVGFGAANNIALRLALDRGYDFVYLLNQDAWLEKDTLGKLVAAYRPDYGVLSPLQKAASGKLDRQFSRKCSRYLKVTSRISAASDLVVDVPFVMAAHWLLSRKAVETVGGFSPVFTQYGEDDNYLDRLRYHGLRCGVVPASSAVHDRASRKPSREDRVRLKCVAPTVKLSDPGKCFLLRAAIEPLELVAIGVKNFSAFPFRRIGPFVRSYGKIRECRRISRGKGAFLP